MDSPQPSSAYKFKGRGKCLFSKLSPDSSNHCCCSQEEKLSSDDPFVKPIKRIKYDVSRMSRDERRDLRSKLNLELEQVRHATETLYHWEQIHQLGPRLAALKKSSSSSTISTGMKEQVMEKDMVIRLQTSDDKVFEVGEAVACHSEIIDKIMTLMEQTGHRNYTSIIPLTTNVCSRTLAMVIDYCEYNVKEYVGDVDKRNKWNEAFVHILVNQPSTFLDITKAAVFLEMKRLKKKCQNCAKAYTIQEIHEASNRIYGLTREVEITVLSGLI